MERSEKKRMIEDYKNTQHPMGVFCIIKKEPIESDPRVHIQIAKNFKAILNSTKMKLNSNFHPFKELQNDWNLYGEEAFDINLLETLEYTKDDPNADYSEELEILKLIWEDTFKANGFRSYEKSLTREKNKL